MMNVDPILSSRASGSITRVETHSSSRDTELSVVLFGDQSVGKRTWLETLGKAAVTSQSYNIAHDVTVHVFKMKANCPTSRFCTFQIYMRPSNPDRSNHSWLGGLEHGYTVNAQGFFVLFDLSTVESYWHQIDFCKSLRLYRDIPVITIGNVTCKHRIGYLPPELHFIQVNVRSEREALRPLTEMRQRLGQSGDILPSSREALAAISAMKDDNIENDENIDKKHQ